MLQVNADRVWWRRKRNWEMEIMNIDTNDVGRDMSTKGIGSNYRQDITKNYKDREGRESDLYTDIIDFTTNIISPNQFFLSCFNNFVL